LDNSIVTTKRVFKMAGPTDIEKAAEEARRKVLGGTEATAGRVFDQAQRTPIVGGLLGLLGIGGQKQEGPGARPTGNAGPRVGLDPLSMITNAAGSMMSSIASRFGKDSEPLDVIKALDKSTSGLRQRGGELAQDAKDKLMATELARTSGMKIDEATAAVAKYRQNPNVTVADFNKSMAGMATSAGNAASGAFSWAKDKVTAGATALATAVTVAATPAPAAPPEGAGKPVVLITEDEAAAERKAQQAEAARIAAVPPTTVVAGPAIVAPPAAAAFTAASDPSATAAKPSATPALDTMIEQANKGSDPGRLETLLRAREQVAKLGAPTPAP
jgi:hypothetical protein